MLKIFYYFLFLSIIVKGQLVQAKKEKKNTYVPTVFKSTLTGYKIEKNNNVIEDKGNGLFQWKKDLTEGKEGLQISGTHENFDIPVEDFCKKEPQTVFPSMLQRFLGIEECPIKKDSISLMTSIFSKPTRKTKSRCDEPENQIFKLYDKEEQKFIMTFNIRQEDIKLGACS